MAGVDDDEVLPPPRATTGDAADGGEAEADDLGPARFDERGDADGLRATTGSKTTSPRARSPRSPRSARSSRPRSPRSSPLDTRPEWKTSSADPSRLNEGMKHGYFRRYFDKDMRSTSPRAIETRRADAEIAAVRGPIVTKASEAEVRRLRELERGWEGRAHVSRSANNDRLHPAQRQFFDRPQAFDEGTPTIKPRLIDGFVPVGPNTYALKRFQVTAERRRSRSRSRSRSPSPTRGDSPASSPASSPAAGSEGSGGGGARRGRSAGGGGAGGAGVGGGAGGGEGAGLTVSMADGEARTPTRAASPRTSSPRTSSPRGSSPRSSSRAGSPRSMFASSKADVEAEARRNAERERLWSPRFGVTASKNNPELHRSFRDYFDAPHDLMPDGTMRRSPSPR